MSFASARLAAVAWHSRGVSHHGHAHQHACSSPQSIPWSMRIESPSRHRGCGGTRDREPTDEAVLCSAFGDNFLFYLVLHLDPWQAM